MKKHALALAVIGACGLVPQAFAHELAFSKKDNIKVEVPGDATTWCKPQVDPVSYTHLTLPTILLV